LRPETDRIEHLAGSGKKGDGIPSRFEGEVEVVFARRFIGKKLDELERGDEGEGLEMEDGVARAKRDAVQSRGQAGRAVVEFEPVRAAGGRIGEPFIDDEVGERNGRGQIRAAGRGKGQCPGSRRADAANAAVGQLQAKRERVHPVGLGVVEGEEFTLATEREAGVEAGGIGGCIAPHHQETVGRNGGVRREHEFAWIAPIAKTPICQRSSRWRSIVNLHPVREQAAVGYSAKVVGH